MPTSTTSEPLPRSVRACRWLWLVAALAGAVSVATAPLTLRHIGTVRRQLVPAVAAIEDPSSYNVSGQVGSLRLAVEIATTLGVVCLLAGVVLAWLFGRGDSRARVVAWPACIVVGAAELFQIATDPGQYVIGDSTADLSGSAAENRVEVLFHSLLPSWYLPMYYLAQTACLAIAIAVVCLMLTRSAQDYFDYSSRSTVADEAKLWDISKIRSARSTLTPKASTSEH